MKRKTRGSQRRRFSMTPDTELWDDDELWDLPAKERKRVQNAMTWGRPLPPELAQVAVKHAPVLESQAWYGWLLIGLSLMFGLVEGLLAARSEGWLLHVAGALLAVAGVLWLLAGGIWLRAVSWARRAVRTGYWPERE